MLSNLPKIILIKKKKKNILHEILTWHVFPLVNDQQITIQIIIPPKRRYTYIHIYKYRDGNWRYKMVYKTEVIYFKIVLESLHIRYYIHNTTHTAG